MRKLLTLALVLCIGAFSGYAFGQQKDAQKNEKKGGFAVGGYDNAKQQQTQEVKKRSVDLNEAAEEKAAEVVAPPAQVSPPPPPPVPDQKAKQTDKEGQGNAYGKDKGGLEGKEFGQTRAQSAKDKQKAKKNSKSKSRR